MQKAIDGEAMNDELTKIQIEIEKIKLERENLALAKELAKHQRFESVTEVGINSAKKAGSIFIYALIFVGSFVVSFFVLLIYASVKDVDKVHADFAYNLGWYLPRDFIWRFFVSLIVGLSAMSVYRSEKNGVKEQSLPLAKVEFSSPGRILISLLLGLFGIFFLVVFFSDAPHKMSLTFIALFEAVIFVLAWLTWPRRRRRL